MATYTIIPRTVPSPERSARITAVAAGDQIDLTEILGRPARGLKIMTTNSTDVISYKLNNLLKIPKLNEWNIPTTVEIWSGSGRYNTFSATGYTEHVTEDSLSISSIDIVSLVGVATIELVIW